MAEPRLPGPWIKLIAMLLPALTAARDTAMTVQCLSNARQLAIGNVMYADDHDDHMIAENHNPANANHPPLQLWTARTREWFGLSPDYENDPTPALFQCPGMARASEDGINTIWWESSYALNRLIGSHHQLDWPGWPMRHQVRQPSRISIFHDENFTSRLSLPHRIHQDPEHFIPRIFTHGGGHTAVVGYIDGHAGQIDIPTWQDAVHVASSSAAPSNYDPPFGPEGNSW